MAYESRIYIVDVHREKDKDNPNYGTVYYAERIAAFNLGCMGYSNGWRELFEKTIDYDLYNEDGDKKINADKYGARLTSADFEKVIEWLEKRSASKEHYRRIAPVLAMLKGFDRSEWDDLQIIHYGY